MATQGDGRLPEGPALCSGRLAAHLLVGPPVPGLDQAAHFTDGETEAVQNSGLQESCGRQAGLPREAERWGRRRDVGDQGSTPRSSLPAWSCLRAGPEEAGPQRLPPQPREPSGGG